MIVRTLEEISGTDRDVNWGNGQSRRLLLQSDGFPFGFTDTTGKAGAESKQQYTNHLEVCYCIEGTGELEVDGKIYKIEPGTMFALEHEKHIIRNTTDIRFICVFMPPLKGQEKHVFSEDGYSSYEA